ncbi:MAG: SDR family NAD(P)-dependent oxidoreductase, partial [Planctomycetota bacterium]
MAERRTAIVTGASSGIGWETALALARRGYWVAVAARREQRLGELVDRCRQAGGEALAVPTDVTDESQVRALVDRAVSETGRVDVMVNNAGRGLFASVAETSTEEMRNVFDVNYFG